MTYTVELIKGINEWVVKDEKGKWVSKTYKTEEEANNAKRDLKDQEKQISLDL